MANQTYIQPGGSTAYRKSDGTGTDLDPFIPHFKQPDFGTAADASSASGSFLARIAALLDRIGQTADAASPTGSLLARLRKIAESNILHRPTAAQYYAGVDGSNVSYNATPGVISGINTGGGTVAIFQNPSASGVDLYIQRLVLSSDIAGRYERYRGATITVTGSAVTNNNRGGNAANTGAGRVYAPTQATAGNQGNLGMITYVPASATSSDAVDGTLILRPGQAFHWRYVPSSNGANCAVEVVWWELPART